VSQTATSLSDSIRNRTPKWLKITYDIISVDQLLLPVLKFCWI